MRESILSRVHSRLHAIKSLAPQDFDCVPPPNRADKRIPTHLFALALTQDGREFKCIVQNMSAGGAGLSMAEIEDLPDEFMLAIDGYAAPALVRLVWRNGSVGGVEFQKITRN